MQAYTLRSQWVRAVAILLGLILALSITPQPTGAVTIPTLKYPWGVGDKDKNGNPIYLTSGPHGAPVNFACNGAFNTNAIRPLIRLSGLDFSMAQGTSVLAAAGGWVVFAGPPTSSDPRGPNVVALDHGDGFMTQYWHLNSVAPTMLINHWVNQGTQVGRSGISGTGQHLHLEFRSYRHPDAPAYNRDNSPGLPYPAHGLAITGLAPNGLPTNYIPRAEIRADVAHGVNYDGTITRGVASRTTQTICSDAATVTNWTGADGTIWASASGGTTAKVTGSTNGPPASPAITVDDVWMADGSFAPDINAPRKTTFNMGQSIRFWVRVNNHTGTTLSSRFVWNTAGPRRLINVNATLTINPGISWWYYTLATVPSNAWGGTYAFRAQSITNGIISGLAQNLTLNLPKPKIYIMLTWNKSLRDLDAHLWGSDHIYFLNVGNLNFAPYAALDIDDNGFGGMETIGISQRQQTVYTFAVYNYGNTLPLRGQLAAVRVKTPNGWREYQAPLTGVGRWWNVFRINANGTITDINTISSTAPVALSPMEQAMEHIAGSTANPPIKNNSSDIPTNPQSVEEWHAP